MRLGVFHIVVLSVRFYEAMIPIRSSGLVRRLII
jgi:hypothetical protein